MGPYIHLFSIEVEHGFFTDGRCRHLEFVPTTQTQRVITNSGLLTRPLDNGIRVVYDRSKLDSLRLHATDAEQPLNLGFKVFSRDSIFSNYTEPEIYLDNSILYFDNQKEETDAAGRFRLPAAETVGESDFQLLDSPALAEVLQGPDLVAKPVFVVNIHLSESDVTPDSASSEIVSANYYIRFNNRQTFWKYYLQGDLARDGLRITDLDNQVEFEPLGPTSWLDRRNALVYRSQTPLPLQERSEYRFQLRENNGGSGRVLIRRLPVPSADQVGRDTVAEEIVPVSEIFVNC